MARVAEAGVAGGDSDRGAPLKEGRVSIHFQPARTVHCSFARWTKMAAGVEWENAG